MSKGPSSTDAFLSSIPGRNPEELKEQIKRVRAHCETSTVRRTLVFGSIRVNMVECDLTAMPVDAVVNAANSLSFMPMDGGVSGALRKACKPVDVTKKEKIYWESDGTAKKSVKVPTTQAGVQAAAGGLADRGVKYIIHAVGPIWSEFPISPKVFRVVPPMIRTTIRNALNAAHRLGDVQSVALPAVSGGIFTHWKEGTDIKEREMKAARVAVVQEVLSWVLALQQQQPEAEGEGDDVHTQLSPSATTTNIRSIDLCDLKGGQMRMFVEAFDEVVAAMSTSSPTPNASTNDGV